MTVAFLPTDTTSSAGSPRVSGYSDPTITASGLTVSTSDGAAGHPLHVAIANYTITPGDHVKHWAEFHLDYIGSTNSWGVGVISPSDLGNLGVYPGDVPGPDGLMVIGADFVFNNVSGGDAAIVTPVSGTTVYGVGVDSETSDITVHENGVQIYAHTLTGVANFAFCLAVSNNRGIKGAIDSDILTANFGATPFAFTPPTGYVGKDGAPPADPVYIGASNRAGVYKGAKSDDSTLYLGPRILF